MVYAHSACLCSSRSMRGNANVAQSESVPMLPLMRGELVVVEKMLADTLCSEFARHRNVDRESGHRYARYKARSTCPTCETMAVP